jgi:hypothetical protein
VNTGGGPEPTAGGALPAIGNSNGGIVNGTIGGGPADPLRAAVIGAPVNGRRFRRA